MCALVVGGCTVANPLATGPASDGPPVADATPVSIHDFAVTASDLATAPSQSDAATEPSDLAAVAPADLTPMSVCSMPGDSGNSIGVGKYCTMQVQCFGLQANLCAAAANPQATFCTKLCTAGTAGQCGDAAACVCGNGRCACVPNRCV